MRVKFTVILDRRKPPKGDLYPIVLRVYFSGKTKLIRVGKLISESDFEKANQIRPRDKHKVNKERFQSYINKAEKIEESLDEWNYNTFKTRFLGGNTDEKEILSLMRVKVKELREQGRFGNSEHYKSNLSQIETFLGKKKTLYFHEVDGAWLHKLEKWYTDRDRSPRSAGVVMQSIRKLFNDAIDKGIIKTTPFGKGGYKIPKSSGTPRSLKVHELQKILNYETDIRQEQEALLYFKLIYLWSGIAVKDLFALKWKNIEGSTLTFQRGKTKNTSGAVIRLPVGDEVRDALSKLSYSKKQNEYILPVYEGTNTDEQRLAKRKNKTKYLNKWLKRIGTKLGFDLKATTYVARHTYGTTSKKLGIPIGYIQNSFGHTTENTTQYYLDKFEDERALEFQNKLTQFDTKEGSRASDG